MVYYIGIRVDKTAVKEANGRKERALLHCLSQVDGVSLVFLVRVGRRMVRVHEGPRSIVRVVVLSGVVRHVVDRR